MERRLAAILATDVVGYSRLIRADEEGTIAALKTLRSDLIDPKIAEHHGRIVKLMGDGMLAEFPSVVDAVRAAVETQQAVAEHNASLPEDRWIEFRVGINLGDVVIDGDDIQGDGVNIAARLEGMAEPGGICISGKVYEEVRDRIDISFEDLGEKEVKNIDRPVQVWQWIADAGLAASISAKMDEPLPLPDKPSIAVLPFVNMSGDPEQEYFSDGITEDIITELSRFRGLFVIARNSSFTFKGEAVDVSEVGRKLGVAYVVEGSVRKAGNRVRITAQLVEVATGNHIWAERYDRDLEDIFAVQDEVVATIVATLPGRIDDARVEHSRRAPTDSLSAYDCILRGRKHLSAYRRHEIADARNAFERAAALDPKSALAQAGMASVHLMDYFWGDSEALPLALQHGERALALDRNEPTALRVLALTLAKLRRADEGVRMLERAVTIVPGSADNAAGMGICLVHAGRHDDALEWLSKALRLDPFQGEWVYEFLGIAHYFTHRFTDAIAAFERIVEPPSWICALFAAAFAMNGDDVAAKDQVRVYARTIEREYESRLTVEQAVKLTTELYQVFKRPEDRRLAVDGFRKAGLPV